MTEFLQPETVEEAVALLAEDPFATKVVAGGTALVLMLRHGLIAPERLVSIGRISGLDGIHTEDGALHIGPLALLDTVARSPEVAGPFPALATACGVVGNVRVRDQATLGGNLAEADYASDPPTVLLALDAVVTVTGPRGARTIPLADFLRGFYTTTLEPDELITDIAVPVLPSSIRMTYLKYRSRSSEDRPAAGRAADCRGGRGLRAGDRNARRFTRVGMVSHRDDPGARAPRAGGAG
jgi:carbon-monoxide dehydrogenase medium subunit